MPDSFEATKKQVFLMKKISLIFALFLAFLAPQAFAVPPDFSTLTAAVDFSTVITALLGIMASLAGVYIVMRGGSMVLQKIRR